MARFMECMSAGQEETLETLSFQRRFHRKTATFPMILHYMLSELEKDNQGCLMSWQPHGRSFIVRNPKQVEKTIIPLWFRQSKFSSFQRQLNLYGFTRIKKGPDSGGYYHKLFVREKAFLAERIGRTIVKGKHCDELNSADYDPDFEAISAFRSEACRSSDIEGHDASTRSTNPTIATPGEAADESSLLPTLVQSTSSKDLNIDLSKGNNRPSEMSLVQSHMAKYTTLTPTYNLIEAIKSTPLSQQDIGRNQITAGHSIHQEQVQRELYKMQANMMVHLEAEAMNKILKSAVVPAAAYLQEYERLCLRSIDAMYERHHALSMNNEIGFLAPRPFAPGSSGFI